ncbi:acetoin reductase [Saccharomonospora azurea]|uniref:acetoin reductase n=1 Tax=Saccharomonospora azurea TaxID=40988 RepID=UPI00023FF8E1|nr:acetoin reductase [Saccharomonospora azurea]EHK88871.1 acetoin reductase family protein [Saccharomonospora azurea SZMC 14600]
MTSTDQRIAIVTGAARGIGKGIAERLARDGLAVAVADLDTMREELSAVARGIEQSGGRSVALTADVSDPEQVNALVRDTVREFGKLDVFVANAGIAAVDPLLDMTLDELDRLVRVNLYGVFNSYQAAARQMIEQGHGGKIIGAASIAAHKGFEMLGGYSVTKWGVRGLTQVAAQEWARHGITVNAYCPGIVGTAMWDLIDEKMTAQTGEERGAALKRFSESIALGRVEEPKDVASFVSYLASPDADYMTGQSVLIDGGILYS